MDCSEIEELLGAYVLRALPPDEERRVRDHLATCRAHTEMTDLRTAVLSLAVSAPAKEPPAALRERLLGAVRDEARQERAAPSARGLRRPIQHLRPLVALAAALGILAAGLLAWNVVLQVSDEGGGTVGLVRQFAGPMAAGSRVLWLSEEGLAVLEIQNLPPVSRDRVYQIWTIGADGRPVSAGLFTVTEDGSATITIRIDPAATRMIAISEEPEGGSDQPTNPPGLVAEL